MADFRGRFIGGAAAQWIVPVAALAGCMLGASVAQAVSLPVKFQFGPGKQVAGYRQVLPDMAYSGRRGYGFDLGFKVKGLNRSDAAGVKGHGVTSPKPFFFSIKLPPGNYNVTVTMGDLRKATSATVKAEQRRLMFKHVVTRPGKFVTRTFTVNTRVPQIGGPRGPHGHNHVHLKPREVGALDWDNKLTVEFSGRRPCLCAMKISKARHPVTLFIAGDSTDTDQRFEPWCSWGQMLPRFFMPRRVVVANYAEDGESANSFIWEQRLHKVMSLIRPGDYLFIEFGHNDQHEHGPDAGPTHEYRASILKMIAQARARRAIPVLVTPMARNLYRHGKLFNSLDGFPGEMRKIARQKHVPLIDLNAMSTRLYAAMGRKGAKKAFVDITHNDDYGAYEIAKCIVRGIRTDRLGLGKFLRPGLKTFNPRHPDPFSKFNLPPDPQYSQKKPSGW